MATKGEQTSQRILQVASQLFWKRSYHGVNMKTVAAAAAVNKASLYQYYPSKEALALATIAANRDGTLNYVFKESFAASTDPLERLAGIYQRAYQTAKMAYECDGKCPGCPFVNIALEMATENESIRKAVAATFAAFAGYYRQIVHDVAKANACSTDEPGMVDALINNMNGGLVASKIQNRPEAILDSLKNARSLLGTIHQHQPGTSG